MLLHSDMDGGSYELYTIPKDANGSTVVRAPLPLCLAACVGTLCWCYRTGAWLTGQAQ